MTSTIPASRLPSVAPTSLSTLALGIYAAVSAGQHEALRAAKLPTVWS